MRIGIFGGTFNPIHIAHLYIAEQVREAMSLNEVVFVPSAVPPHKEVEYKVSARRRISPQSSTSSTPELPTNSTSGRERASR